MTHYPHPSYTTQRASVSSQSPGNPLHTVTHKTLSFSKTNKHHAFATALSASIVAPLYITHRQKERARTSERTAAPPPARQRHSSGSRSHSLSLARAREFLSSVALLLSSVCSLLLSRSRLSRIQSGVPRFNERGV